MNYMDEARRLISKLSNNDKVVLPYAQGAELEKDLVGLLIRVAAIGPKDEMFWEELDLLAKKGNKIKSVKLVRSATGLGLKDSIEVVEKVYPILSACRLCKRLVTKCKCNPDGHPILKDLGR